MQRRQQEQEVTFIKNKEDKENNSIAKTESSLKKSLYMRSVVPGVDHIHHGGRENFAFRLPTQTNLP